jgi:hypothetical protein
MFLCLTFFDQEYVCMYCIFKGANAYVMSFWGEKAGPYMQGLHFCFSMGGIVSPLATEPFLAERSCHYLNLTGIPYFVYRHYMHIFN